MKKLGTLIVALLVAPMFALAQEDTGSEANTSAEAPAETTTEQSTNEANDSSEAAPRGKVEKIQVTGSHIKRIDVEGPSPVLTLDRDYLDKTGYNSVADVLRDTTVAGLGADREAGLSGGADAGAATTSVRGMTSNNILVLLDGKRMPTIGGSTRVDLNLIPMAAIERVEILKDGASAIYGSDALGGVINFITKRNFDGASVTLRHFQPEEPGGQRTDVTGTWGTTGSNYDFLAVLNYRNNRPVAMRDRDFFIPTDPYLSPTGSPGSWKNHDDPETAWNAGGGAAPCTGSVDGRGRCRFDYSPYMNVIPEIEQFSTLLNGGYEINENLKVFARGIYTRRIVKTQLAPPPDGFLDERDPGTSGIDTRIPKAVADAWGLPPGATSVNGASPGNDVDVIYRLVEEVGPRKSEITSDSVGISSGVEGYLWNTWEWEFSGNYAETKTSNRGVSGFANKLQMRQKTVADPTYFNPFAASGNKSDISDSTYVPVLDINSSVATVLMSATGEIASLSTGPVAMAVGVSTNWQTFEQTADGVTASGAQWGGSTSAEGSGRRDFQSMYTEFSVPALRNLELQLAGRFDNYSDFGSTVNPKVGFRYKPLNSFMLRGTWGTGFKAPALEDLYESGTVSYPFGYDAVADENAQFKTFGSGNPNLKEETSTSFNVGFVWQILDRLSFSTDYYVTEQNDVVQRVSSDTVRDLFRAEAAGIDLSQFGIEIVRNPAGTGAVERIVAPNLNLASRTSEGLEFRLAYNTPVFGNWTLTSIVDYSYLLRIDEIAFPGLSAQNRVGWAGNPYWRNNIAIGMSNNTWGINSLIRTIGEQNASATAPGTVGKTRDHTELDLQASYAASWDGVFSLGVRNVFGTDRPWQNEHLANGFINTSLYDPFGRTFWGSYTQNF